MYEGRRALPRNLRDEEAIKSLFYAFDKNLQGIGAEVRDFWWKLLPDTSPQEWLRWLFYALGGEDYIYPEFDETWMRKVLRRLFDLYKTKGTYEGMRLHIDVLTPAKFLELHHAPDKNFLGSSLTDEDRLLFESKMPRIRAYPYRHKGVLWGMACKISYLSSGEHMVKSDALLRIGEYVELYDPVLEEAVPLNFFVLDKEQVERSAQKIVEIRKKSIVKGIFCGGYIAGFVVDNNAKERLYRVCLSEPYKDIVERRHPVSIRPSLEPIRTYYEMEYVKGKAKAELFPGNKWTDVYPDRWKQYLGVETFLLRSDADMRIRKVITLFDPDRVVYPDRKARFFLGAMRVGGLKAHHSELFVDLRGKAPEMKFYLSAGFLSLEVPSENFIQQRVEWVLWAAEKGRRAGEKVTCSISNTRTIRVRTSVICGEYLCGQYEQVVV